MDWESAVQSRQVVRFVYDGLERVVQPATFGVSTAGKITLRACQVGGRSHRGVLPDWRPFSVIKIVDPSLTGEVFADFAASGYTTGDSMFVSIIAER